MSDIKVALILPCSGLLTKILTIREAELLRTRAGLSIIKMK